MLDNYFNLQPPEHNDEDLHNLLYKKLITDAFINNEVDFDKTLESLKEKNISLFGTFTIYPQYSAYQDGNDIMVERNESDYNSFIAASINFIKEEKYLIKLIKALTRDDVEKNQEPMTALIIGLLDNNFTNALSTIINNDLLSEKEIKLKLILPENSYHYHHRKINFHTFETDFLSKHIHELNITKRNSHKLNEIYSHVLKNVNSEQYKSISKCINKVDFSIMEGYSKKEIFKTLLEFAIIQPNQTIGYDKLLDNPQIEVKSFLDLGENALENIIKKQSSHLEKRLNSTDNSEIIKEKIRKI